MKLIASFKYALNGIKTALLSERNFQIECMLGLLILLPAIIFKISSIEWMIIIGCMGLVLSLELINTVIEKLCNFFHADFHPQIKIIKDISAAAVLIGAIASVVIALFIFLPKIFY